MLLDPQRTAALEQILASPEYQIVTSNYVWMEYQRTIVADYAHIHRVMMGQQSDWAGLFRHLLDGSRGFRPRSAVRCTKIIGNLYEESRQIYTFAYDIVSLQIRHGLRQKFWTHLSRLPDSIVCDLVETGIERQADGHFSVAQSCRKEMARCHLPRLFNENRSKLKLIVDYLATHPQVIKDQPRVERLLKAALEAPNSVLGQSSCWPLGDLIIALQVPEDAFLWTLDADFKLFATVLGLKLYQPK